jgi:hypothetical protein
VKQLAQSAREEQQLDELLQVCGSVAVWRVLLARLVPGYVYVTAAHTQKHTTHATSCVVTHARTHARTSPPPRPTHIHTHDCAGAAAPDAARRAVERAAVPLPCGRE